MRQDDRAPFDQALHRARVAAYPTGEFVGQESFMTAAEIRALAVQAGIGPGVAVLDVCCGIAGPGRFLTRELGCAYLGVDASASAVAIARERAGDLPCRFAVAHVPPLPPGTFDVVLLLETMLAFEDKDALVGAIAAALRPGGRFAFTLEGGGRTTAARTARRPRRWRTRSLRTPAPSPRGSAAGRWTTCSPRTGSGSSGWTPGACGSSRWWRSGPSSPGRPARSDRRWTRCCSDSRWASAPGSHPDPSSRS